MAYRCSTAHQKARTRTDRDATDLIGEAWQYQAELIVIPVERFADGFFQLETRMAGEITQKFVGYGLRLVILGDVSRYVEQSSALASDVYESNRGKHVWFVANREELVQRLNSGR